MNDLLQLPMLGDHPNSPFPPTSEAFTTPNGLLAWGGDLQPERLLNAYRRGIFPWYGDDQPILWWSPAPRCVLDPRQAYMSRRTRRRYNSGCFRLSLNRAFGDVVAACAEPRATPDGADEGTWITREMAAAYGLLHEAGHAHSLEVWQGDELAGGIYGLAIGAVFFGESMFSRSSDASKIALLALCRLLIRQGFELMDCQVANPHLERMGAKLIPRDDFENRLEHLVNRAVPTGFWTQAPLFDEKW